MNATDIWKYKESEKMAEYFGIEIFSTNTEFGVVYNDGYICNFSNVSEMYYFFLGYAARIREGGRK